MRKVKKMSQHLDVTELNFDNEVLHSKIPVLVDFWAPWCGPCKTIGPFVEKLSDEYSGRIKVVKVNVDENGKVAEALGIKGIPAIYTFKDGNIFEQHVGSPQNPMKKLKQMADNVLA